MKPISKINYSAIFISFLFVWQMIFALETKAQSSFLMRYLPRDPTIPQEPKVQKGLHRWVNLKDEISKGNEITDTMSIKHYDTLGRVSEQITFSGAKRSSHSYKDYPDETTTRSYSNMPMSNGVILRNYIETEIDTLDIYYSVRSYQVSNHGDTITNNNTQYEHDSRGRLIFQCDGCNAESPIKRYFHYNDKALVKVYETRVDTVVAFDLSDMTYNEEGKMTRYIYRNIFKGDTTLSQDCFYEYHKGRLVRQKQYNDFEKVWREFVYQYDTLGHLSHSYGIIETDTSSTSYFYEGDKLMRTFATTTFQYNDGNTFFGQKFRNNPDRIHHNTEIKYTHDNNGRLVVQELYFDGLLRRRYRNIYE